MAHIRVNLENLTSEGAFDLLEEIPSDGESIIGETDDEIEDDVQVTNDVLYLDDSLDSLNRDKNNNETGSDSDDNIPLIHFASWRKVDFYPVLQDCSIKTGLTDLVPNELNSPVDFFLLLFDNELLDYIVEQTNLYAQQQGKKHPDTTRTELKLFLGMNLLMGIKPLPSYRDYWSSKPEMRDTFISSKMSLHRFGYMLSNLHMNDNTIMPKKGEENYDKLYKIRPYLDKLLQNYKQYYNPTKCQAIDESMVKYKGRVSYKQYMPLKPIKRGYKIWVRADKEGYVCDFQIYTGKQEAGIETALGERVVHDMTAGLEGKGYHVYFDNFFTTTNLMESLEKGGIYACGTVRSNRKNLPKNLASEKELQRGEWDWCSKNNKISCVRWKDKRVVQLLSVIHSPTACTVVQRKEKDGSVTEIKCPNIVYDYRKNMGCVDKADMLKSYYGIDRKSKKWWHRLFFHFLDTTLVNAYVLFKTKTGKSMPLKTFRSAVSVALMGASTARPNSAGRSSSPLALGKFKPQIPAEVRKDQAKHLPSYGTSRRCAVCSTAKEPHRTKWSCTLCQVGLCLNDKKNCFVTFHTK